jgi:hypothetical protein
MHFKRLSFPKMLIDLLLILCSNLVEHFIPSLRQTPQSLPDLRHLLLFY